MRLCGNRYGRGLQISLVKEYSTEGNDVFCSKLRCLENTREDDEILGLVNMSVYRISEFEGKIVLASVSESDLSVRNYKQTHVKGNFEHTFGELTVSFTKASDCFSAVFGCDVYYTNRRGLIKKKENKTKPVDQVNRKPLMLMTLEAKTPEFDKTIDKMSEFLKTFKYQDQLNNADLKMQLQFLNDNQILNQTVPQVYNAKEITVKHTVLGNATNMKERKHQSSSFDQVEKTQTLENSGTKNTITSDESFQISETCNETKQVLISKEIQTSTAIMERQTTKVEDVLRQLNILIKHQEKLSARVENVSLDIQRFSNATKNSQVLYKTMMDLKMDLLNLTNEKIKNNAESFAEIQNRSMKKLEENSKLQYESHIKSLRNLIMKALELNDSDNQINGSVLTSNDTMESLTSKAKDIDDLINKLLGTKISILNQIEQLKCTTMMKDVFKDLTKAEVAVNRISCDNETDGGGWIIIQRRIKGDVNFTRPWKDYKEGFGSTTGDFWLGNDVISALTNLGFNELRFDMKYEGTDYYAVYTGFKVENEEAKYKMSYTSFSGGNVIDNLSLHQGMKFTTIDSDNDRSSKNCAIDRRGGWWYEDCHYVNVNGEWGSLVNRKGVHWNSVTGHDYSLDFVEMKVRKT
ncbi:angiopoietin-2-like [Physella acuta]|uniref:angiopoietin-2-like n=1 Tax=Physella acuta TaxID=109671 RepID=UPI0027DB42F5|nr:angiopoietin-2-like [Physella acuta]